MQMKGSLQKLFFAVKVFFVNFNFSFPRVPQTHFVRFTSWYTSSKKNKKSSQISCAARNYTRTLRFELFCCRGKNKIPKNT